MAQFVVVPMGKQKRHKEAKMPQNETPPETNEQTADAGVNETDAETVNENAQSEVADRETAALEEALAKQQITEARANNDAVAAEMDAAAPTLIGAAAKGRGHLLDQLRAHAATTAANKKEYVPPPPTDRQSENTRLEMEAGARASARAQAQLDSRPQPARDPRDPGPNTPVHRPNDVVPDPLARAVSGSGGPLKPFSPNV